MSAEISAISAAAVRSIESNDKEAAAKSAAAEAEIVTDLIVSRDKTVLKDRSLMQAKATLRGATSSTADCNEEQSSSDEEDSDDSGDTETDYEEESSKGVPPVALVLFPSIDESKPLKANDTEGSSSDSSSDEEDGDQEDDGEVSTPLDQVASAAIHVRVPVASEQTEALPATASIASAKVPIQSAQTATSACDKMVVANKNIEEGKESGGSSSDSSDDDSDDDSDDEEAVVLSENVPSALSTTIPDDAVAPTVEGSTAGAAVSAAAVVVVPTELKVPTSDSSGSSSSSSSESDDDSDAETVTEDDRKRKNPLVAEPVLFDLNGPGDAQADVSSSDSDDDSDDDDDDDEKEEDKMKGVEEANSVVTMSTQANQSAASLSNGSSPLLPPVMTIDKQQSGAALAQTGTVRSAIATNATGGVLTGGVLPVDTTGAAPSANSVTLLNGSTPTAVESNESSSSSDDDDDDSGSETESEKGVKRPLGAACPPSTAPTVKAPLAVAVSGDGASMSSTSAVTADISNPAARTIVEHNVLSSSKGVDEVGAFTAETDAYDDTDITNGVEDNYPSSDSDDDNSTVGPSTQENGVLASQTSVPSTSITDKNNGVKDVQKVFEKGNKSKSRNSDTSSSSEEDSGDDSSVEHQIPVKKPPLALMVGIPHR